MRSNLNKPSACQRRKKPFQPGAVFFLGLRIPLKEHIIHADFCALRVEHRRRDLRGLNIAAPVADRIETVELDPHAQLAGRQGLLQFIKRAPQTERQRHQEERAGLAYGFSTSAAEVVRSSACLRRRACTGP
ncbi:hypothetical protein ESA_01037 [Cronobacter sakazakii ATCC BAA-894]|uniref:Uncharacterized protein n=1 Tax=Cronobacter sakazakii (strain ATCC BAA-894) TaxID=290339 RepID=A7MLP3_CROS8|nr:hypothetical protein ESA_01037 [Cronobacter sakazakii ATCC BAA-894]